MKNILSIVALVIPGILLAQNTPPAPYTGTTINYTRIWEATAPGQTPAGMAAAPLSDVKQTTQYFDALGRPIQTVTKQGSPLGKDNVSVNTYDNGGMETFKYLAFVSTAAQGGDVTNDGKFKPDGFQQQVTFYNSLLQGQSGETNVGASSLNWAYSQDNFETSPLNRILSSYAPGANWVGSQTGGSPHGVKVQTLANTAVDNVQIWNIAAAQGSLPISGGAYGAGQLYKTISIDEQGRQNITYKDIYGQVVLTKVQNTATSDNGTGSAHAGWLCTYNVFDDYGNLRFIITPAVVQQIDGSWAVSQPLADEFCYRFEYDLQNRLVIKKTPGTQAGSAGEVWMVYDSRNRLVMTQDGNMRPNSQWLCYLFDALDRPVMTGTIVYNGTFSQLQQTVTTQTAGNTSGTVSGAAPPSVQANLNLSAESMSGDWQASQNIVLGPGFTSAPGGTFTAEIVAPTVTDPNHFVVVNNNPLPSGAAFSPLTATFFDNYNWLPSSGAGLSSLLNQTYTQNSTYFNTNYNTAPIYAQPMIQSSEIQGQVTGQMTAVIGVSSPALYNLSIYDDRSRVIQSQSNNLTGGIDIVTNQYDWNGKPIQNLVSHAKNGTNAQTHLVSTIMGYDVMARLLTVGKTLSSTINGVTVSTPSTTIASDQYDELGRLHQRTLGNNMETQLHDYNVRGWPLGMNRNYAKTASLNANYFGFELGYDKGSITDNNGSTIGSYTNPAFNGDIAGTVWKTRGDNQVRKYDYSYDAPNRLSAADFNQYSGSAFNKSAGLDFSVGNMGYDGNGNIQSMNQSGWLLGGSQQIDQLIYHYNLTGNSNRLQYVTDNSPYNNSNPQSILGDLHYAGTKTTASVDYGYDPNGNITSDFNRSISAITYNYLNQPLLITLTNGKGTIQFIYDAAGNKLRKITTENSTTVTYNGQAYTTGITTTTTYINGFVYRTVSYTNPSLATLQYTDKFLFVGDEEGRIRALYNNAASPNTPTTLSFDYFLRDNLDNVRMVLTDEQQQDTYMAATIESNSIGTEQGYYNIVNDAAHVIPVSSLGWWSGDAGTSYPDNNGISNPGNPNPNATSAQVYRLNGQTGDRFGLGITLKVMAGDQISIFGKSIWHNTGASTGSFPITDVLSSFINAFAGTSAVAAGGHGLVNGSTLNSNSATTGPLGLLLGTTPGQPSPGTEPKAAINWILFNDQFVPLSVGTDLVNSTGDAVKSHSILNIPMAANGYLYVYASNESDIDVYFDNLQVSDQRGPILEETHYYPVGLAMAGISDHAWNKLPNFSRYQGNEMQDQEFNDGTGLQEYDFKARFYDDQLGVWHNQDPAHQFASPYSAMANNWPKFTDKDGKFLPILIPIIIGAISGAFIGGVEADMNHQSVWGGIGKGFLVGAVSGGLSEFGAGTFLSQLAWGAGEGAFTGALNALLNGSNVGQGALSGAAIGTAFAAVSATVESLRNLDDGYGFGTNDGRIAHMLNEIHNELPPGAEEDPIKVGLLAPDVKKKCQELADFFVKRFGGPPISVTWFGRNNKDLSPYTDLNGAIHIPITNFYDEQNFVVDDFAHETAHNLRSVVRDANGNPTGGWRVEGVDVIKDPHGTIGYFDTIRKAGRYHIGLSAWLHNPDAELMRTAWDAFGWKKWFDVLPLRY